MKKTLFIMLSLLSATSFAQVTDADVEHDMQALANRNPTIAQSVINDQWRLYNKPPQEVDNKGWDLRVWSSITRGGCCGYVTRTWYGKFDKQTGRFLGYINQHEESNSINGPHWR